MPEIGRCFLFFMKYPAEMERLYEADEPNVDGLPDPDLVLEQVRAVGDSACEEAAELLEECAAAIKAQFADIAPLEQVRNNVESRWEIRFRILDSKSQRQRLEIGVTIAFEPPSLVPWIWSAGGRRAADEMMRILGQGASGTKYGWNAGCVTFTPANIAIPEHLDRPQESTSIVNQIRREFRIFDAKSVQRVGLIRKN